MPMPTSLDYSSQPLSSALYDAVSELYPYVGVDAVKTLRTNHQTMHAMMTSFHGMRVPMTYETVAGIHYARVTGPFGVLSFYATLDCPQHIGYLICTNPAVEVEVRFAC